MSSRRRNLFVILVVAGLLAGSLAAIASKPTRLGLDLKGGIELVYQGQPTPQSQVTAEAIDRSIDIMRKRVDALGVSEPEIQRLGGDQISVGLPDVSNAERAREQVGTTAQLYFYDFEANVVPHGSDERPLASLYRAVKRASRREPERDANNTTGRQFYLFSSKKKLLAGPERSRDGLLSDFDERKPKGATILEVPPGTVVVRAERPPNASPDVEVNQFYVLEDDPELKGTDIRNPEQNFDNSPGGLGQPNVTMEFTGEGRKKFHTVTRRLAQRGQDEQIPGQPPDLQTFAIVLDGDIKSRASIDFTEYPDGIDGRQGAQISGGFDIQEAQDLAEILRIGALPINLSLISETQISATLGKQALRQGLVAGVVGFAVVLLFLLLFFRALGAIAGLALLTYVAFFYALIKLIPITLSLPGIAGLILTIGVAADSNIVIFERIKEEIRAGKSTRSAIGAGYSRGIRTIIDANVVTLITAFVLFILATSGVKGFAFALGVGTLVSLFTAVVFTQALLGTISGSRILGNPAMLGIGKRRVRWNFDFMGKSKLFFAMSGVILLVGAISISTKGLNLGIDFESGTRVTASLERPASVEDVRKALGPLGLEDAKIQEVDDPELGANVVQVAMPQLGPNEVQRVQDSLDKDLGVVKDGFSSTSVGPTFGATVARSALYAVVFSLITIMAYVAFRFEPKFAIPVLLALIHDLLITAGVYSLTGREVTTSTVAALLTILGYSLYDTVIVFDRVRENAPRMPRAAFSQIVNRSMSEVLTRSLATTFSTLLPVTALLLFGGETLKDFAFALLVGIASGTYSSIFIASPVLTAWKERERVYTLRRRRIVADLGAVPAFALATVGGVPVSGPVASAGARDLEGTRTGEREDIGEAEGGELEVEPGAAEVAQEDEVELAVEDEPEARAETGGDGAAEAASKKAERSRRKKRSRRRSRRKHGRHR